MALKLTIGKKLALAFGTTLAFLAVVAAFGLLRLGDVADGMHTVVDVYNKQTRLAATMRIAINDVTIASRGIALVESPEEVKPQQERIVAARKAYDAAEKELATMFDARAETTADEKALLARITKAREKTRPLTNKAIELVQFTGRSSWVASL